MKLAGQSQKSPSRSGGVVLALFAALVLLLSSCGSSVAPLDDEVARQFDIANNSIADLTNGEGVEQVPFDELIRVVARADQTGTDLRIVVVGPNSEFVPAESVVDRYGGTAISYQVDRTGFEGASKDLGGAVLSQAVNAAGVELDIGESASAFVSVLENQPDGVATTSSSSSQLWLLALLIPAAAFMLWGAWSYFGARKARIKRQTSFDERKWVLADWARQLTPELETLSPIVVASPDREAQRIWHESHDFVDEVIPSIENATSIAELDAAEIRIGRTAIRLRDLRKSLTGGAESPA